MSWAVVHCYNFEHFLYFQRLKKKIIHSIYVMGEDSMRAYCSMLMELEILTFISNYGLKGLAS